LKQFFPVSQPSLGEKELEYVSDAVKSGWVSSIGKYIEQFETMFASFCGAQYALATSNGTTALHLALVSMGIKAGDEVIIPDLTFVATANAVVYTGAKVVPVDIDSRTLCIDPGAVERAITSRTRAIIPVHLYGHPAQMGRLMAIAKERGLVVIEDAAEGCSASTATR
jgi:perosamine synthetase